MPRRLIITKVCFGVTAVLLVAVAVVVTSFLWPQFELLGGVSSIKFGAPGGDAVQGIFSRATTLLWGRLIVCWVLLVGSVITLLTVVRGLNRLRYSAWITGIVISGLLIGSVLLGNIPGLILGSLSLWGLVDPESVVAFKPRELDAPTDI